MPRAITHSGALGDLHLGPSWERGEKDLDPKKYATENPAPLPTGVDNAFNPRFLSKLDENEDPTTSYEAANGGFWRVVPLADDKFGLFRLWESPERGNEPFAILTDRPLALLAVAFLPLVARARTLYTYPVDDGDGYTLERGGQTVGRLRTADPELVEVLNLAEALARSPTSIASFLEAAGSAALEEGGKIVARGVSPKA